MATVARTCDVFISHSAADRETARLVAHSLESVGFATFHLGLVEAERNVSEAVWEALSESHAVIAIISSEFLSNSNIMLELGMASAWNKPVFLIAKDPESALPTGVLQKYPTYPLGRLDDLILAIKRGLSPLSEREHGILADIYREVAVPADQLSQSSESLSKITAEFRRQTNKLFSDERLLYELLRLRKRGQLPRVVSNRRGLPR
jgi:hypothetical protein